MGVINMTILYVTVYLLTGVLFFWWRQREKDPSGEKTEEVVNKAGRDYFYQTGHDMSGRHKKVILIIALFFVVLSWPVGLISVTIKQLFK